MRPVTYNNVFHKFICELLCQMGDSSLSFFQNNPVNKKRKRWVCIARLCRARRQHWYSALFSLILLHNLNKEKIFGPCWCRCGKKPRTLWASLFKSCLTATDWAKEKQRKIWKEANSNSRWILLSYYFFMCEVQWFKTLASCCSLDYDGFAAESSGQPVPSAQPFFLMLLPHVFQWTEILQCLTWSVQVI